jgi:hypothetical protein
MKTIRLFILGLLMSCSYIHAQQAIVSAGQEISGSAGIISVSIGQIHYITIPQVVSGVQQPFLEQYVLSVKAVEGGDYINTEYYENEEVILNAIATNSCSTFSSWSDGNTDNPRTIIVTGDATYTAEFEQIQYTIEAQSVDAGQGSATVTNP